MVILPALLVFAVPSAQAQDPSALFRTAGWLVGDGIDDFGAAVAGASDLDGDGIDDLVIGAPYHSDAVGSRMGAALVVPGGSDWSMDAGDWVFSEDANAEFGTAGAAVESVGDVNGDGYGDVAVGAPGGLDASLTVGAVVLLLGGPAGPEQRLVDIGYQQSGFGAALAAAGDLDDDGFSDFIVGAPYQVVDGLAEGSVWVASGGPDGVELRDLAQSLGENGVQLGREVAVPGDVDGDGRVDVVAASYAGPGTGGAIHLFSGASAAATLLSPPAETGLFGWTLGAGGDTDLDGYPDLLVGETGGGVAQLWTWFGTPDGGLSPGETAVFDASAGQVSAFVGLGDRTGDGYPEAVAVSGSAVTLYGGSVAGLTPLGDLDVVVGYNGIAVPLGDVTGDGVADLAVSAADQGVWILDGCPDDDDDGVCAAVDCDDTSPFVGAGEVLRYRDEDGDGFGNALAVQRSCAPTDDPALVTVAGDCDDQDATRHPDAPEQVGDAVDSDCDGRELCFVDADGDGYTAAGEVIESADAACDGALEAAQESDEPDCDDLDDGVWPGNREICGDGVDNDCDGRGGPDDDEDGDGLSHTEERLLGTFPCNEDSDGDGVPDGEDDTPRGGGAASGPSGAPAEPGGCAAGGRVGWLGALVGWGLAAGRRRGDSADPDTA